MTIGIYIRKILGLDVVEDYSWKDSQIIIGLNEDSFISNTQTIKGMNDCNLILRPNANIEIEGSLKGNVIGLGNNIVRISGEFEGTVSCNKTVILKGGKLVGKVWTKKLIIQDKKEIILKGEVRPEELVPFTIPAEKINFEYIKKL